MPLGELFRSLRENAFQTLSCNYGMLETIGFEQSYINDLEADRLQKPDLVSLKALGRYYATCTGLSPELIEKAVILEYATAFTARPDMVAQEYATAFTARPDMVAQELIH